MFQGIPRGHNDTESASNAGEARGVDSIPESGRSPGGRNGTPLQNSCLGNTMDGGAWKTTVHEVTKSQLCLRD